MSRIEIHHYDIALAKLEDVLLLLEGSVRQCEAIYQDRDALLQEENCYKHIKKLFDYIEEQSMNI